MYKTPISTLQELMVERKKCMPNYHIESCNDVPGTSFKCTVRIGEIEACGYATTKKAAKHNSASKALEHLGYNVSLEQRVLRPVVNNAVSIPKNTPIINFVGKLNEYASMNQQMYPSYNNEMLLSVNGGFIVQCKFYNLTTEGHGSNKKDAKQDAARKMLARLKSEVVIVTAGMESLRINKVEVIEELSKKIMKTYEALASSDQNVIPETDKCTAIPNLKEKATTLEELKYEMEQYGYRYTIETFQRNPSYIMMMKITGKTAVFMGSAETKEEALRDLFDSVLHMLDHGFSLNTAF